MRCVVGCRMNIKMDKSGPVNTYNQELWIKESVICFTKEILVFGDGAVKIQVTFLSLVFSNAM